MVLGRLWVELRIACCGVHDAHSTCDLPSSCGLIRDWWRSRMWLCVEQVTGGRLNAVLGRSMSSGEECNVL